MGFRLLVNFISDGDFRIFVLYPKRILVMGPYVMWGVFNNIVRTFMVFFYWFIAWDWKYSDDVGVKNITMEIRLMWQDKWCKGGAMGQLSKCVGKLVEISFFVFSIYMKHLWLMGWIFFLFPLCRCNNG